jgi:hypothetical protein
MRIRIRPCNYPGHSTKSSNNAGLLFRVVEKFVADRSPPSPGTFGASIHGREFRDKLTPFIASSQRCGV